MEETLRIKKKHGIYFYKHTCRCGNIKYIPLLFLNIRFSFNNKIYTTCKSCGYTSCIRVVEMIHSETIDQETKKMNKNYKSKTEVQKSKVWNRG